MIKQGFEPTIEVKVVRKYRKAGYTIGKLYIDGEFICDTLEDTDRGLDDSMNISLINSLKVYGKTAIPTGEYLLRMDILSPKFYNYSWAKPYVGKIPRIEDVKGFIGVLIHPGNSDADTLGCILCGYNESNGKVLRSQEAFHKIMSKLKGHKFGKIIIM